ncbi:MAG: DUF4357 domain-containing protein, partial [Candidatus Gracilibacteria bacterium]|nr:DUF4357 domain-containing protein [Candidatus Gracilibacteria bacterium]
SIDKTKLTNNTDFIYGLNLNPEEAKKISVFFNENEGENKVVFAEKYIEFLDKNKNIDALIPDWINEIKTFFGFNKDISNKSFIKDANEIKFKDYNLNRLNQYKKQKDLSGNKLKAMQFVINDVLTDNLEILKEDLYEVLKLFYINYWSKKYINSIEFRNKVFSYLGGENQQEKKYYLHARGSEAEGILREDGFLVKKGSKGPKDLQDNVVINKGSALRKRPELLAQGIIKEEGNKIIFIEDYLFSSPSGACDIITGGSYNGREVWINKNGKTLNEIEGEGV